MPKTKKTDKSAKQKAQDIRNIMDIEITSKSKRGVLNIVRRAISLGEPIRLVTPNPEIALQARNNAKLKSAINSFEVAIPDGIGIVMADRFLRMPAPNPKPIRTLVCITQGVVVGASLLFKKDWLTRDLKPLKGREFFVDLVAQASKDGNRVVLVGGRSNVAVVAADKFKSDHPGLEIMGIQGAEYDDNANPVSQNYTKIHSDTLKKIRRFKPDMIFVALGAPRQELWIEKYMDKTGAKLAMAVGGSFDFVAGATALPPKTFEKLHLEWLWRLIQEPSRLERIKNAVVVFPWEVFKWKVRN